MKKALSALLAVAVVLSLAAPLVSAATVEGTVTAAPAVTEIKVGEEIKLTPADFTANQDTGTNPYGLLYWDVKGDDNFCVVFRPETVVDESLLVGIFKPSNSTQVVTGNDGSMIIQGIAAGTVTIYVESVDGRDENGVPREPTWTATYTLTIKAEDDPPPEPGNDLLDILRTWWFDLKWTWDYQIHPFFKYVYFNTCGWIASAWNLFITWISSLFA
jgi:hypothetical protein